MRFRVPSLLMFLLVWLIFGCEFKKGMNVPVGRELREQRDGFRVGSSPFWARESCTSRWSVSGLREWWWTGTLQEACNDLLLAKPASELSDLRVLSPRSLRMKWWHQTAMQPDRFCGMGSLQALSFPRGDHQPVPSAVALLAGWCKDCWDYLLSPSGQTQSAPEWSRSLHWKLLPVEGGHGWNTMQRICLIRGCILREEKNKNCWSFSTLAYFNSSCPQSGIPDSC